MDNPMWDCAFISHLVVSIVQSSYIYIYRNWSARKSARELFGSNFSGKYLRQCMYRKACESIKIPLSRD